MANDYLLIRRVANQSISRNATTDVSWDTEDVDDSGYFALAAPTKALTVPAGKAGNFILSMNCSMSGTDVQDRVFLQYSIYNSGDTQIGGIRKPFGHQDQLGDATIKTTLAVGDYVKFQVYQDWGGGAQNFTGRLEMLRIT